MKNICDDLNIDYLVSIHNELDTNNKKEQFNVGYL